MGEQAQIDAFIRHARRVKRWAALRLAIDYPYHGSPVDEFRAEFRNSLADLVPAETTITFVSSVTGKVCSGQELDAEYWCDNARRPVAYAAAVGTLKELGFRAFLEVGPAPVLGNYTVDSLGDAAATVVLSSFEMRDTAAVNPVERTVARALVNGFKFDRTRLMPAPRQFRRDLPRYRWNATDVRIDQTPAVLNRFGNSDDCHPLLGREEGIKAGVWLSELDQHVCPHFCDHRVGGKVVMPGTALAEMALAAARAALATDQVELRDADIMAPVMLSRNALYEIRTRVSVDEATVRIGGRRRGSDGAMRAHVSARFYRAEPELLQEPAPNPDLREADKAGGRLYSALRRLGLDYGPKFALLERLRHVEDGVVEVFLRESPPIGGPESPTLIDVIGADAVFHGVIGALEHSDLARNGLGYVPIHIARLSVLKPWAKVASARIRIGRTGQRSVLASFSLFDAVGDGIALFEGVRFQAVRLLREANLVHHAFRQTVVPLEPAEGDVPEVTPVLLREAAAKTGLEALDDAFFVIEAAAQAVATEALARLADATGLIVARNQIPNTYLSALIGMGLRAETVTAGVLGPQLSAPDAVRDPGPLLDMIAHEYPGLVSELALLVHLRATLPDLLLPHRPLPSASAHMGRAALANLTDGSVFERGQVTALAGVVLQLVANWPAGRALRIAEISDGSARVLAHLVRSLHAGRASLFEIVVPTIDEPGAMTSQPIDRVTVLEAKAEAMQAAGPFDLVLSANMLNRVVAAQDLLSLIGAALSNRGQLVAVESGPSDFADLVFGLDPDWFVDSMAHFEPLSRRYSQSDLGALARRAGLTQIETKALPDESAAASFLIARSHLQLVGDGPTIATGAEQIAELLAGAPVDGIRDLATAGIRVDARALALSGPIVLFERSAATDDPVTRTAARILALKDLLAQAEAEQSRIIALVPGGTGQNGGVPDPGQISTWALLRTAANEHPALSIACYDIAPDLAPQVAAARIARLEAMPARETEVLVRKGGDAALRVMHGVGEPVAHSTTERRRMVLAAPASGGLDELRWRAAPRPVAGPGEVEIAVAATGLNYRDVMWSMGLLPEEALEGGFAGPTLGIECSGTVLATGPGVTRLKPGDRVLAFGPGSFASHLVVREDMAAVLPAGMNLAAATTVPVAFFTAWYALITLAALKPGEWVLIHGGAGGVGLAAIQIAQHAGARVVATASSPVKVSFLRSLGVQHVLDSRSLSFAEGVMGLTGGRGVDVVLNSLAGAAMERSLNAIAPFGRFLELGKQDFYANTAVGLRPLKANIAYHGIDVDQLMAVRPDLAKAIYAEMMEAFQQGVLRALPFRAFDGADVVSAFRLMQKSGHIGKIVVRPPDPQSTALAAPRAGSLQVNREGTHLVVGGLGGLGLEVAEWLVDSGARSLALMGRQSNPSPQVAARIDGWRSAGVDVEIVACDVADATALEAALAALRAKRPIVSVIHSAMVLEDMPLTAVTAEVLARTLPAKIAGAANLDRLTRADPLEHFVLFSSIATLIGNHGQSSYVAANGFLEGVARKRRADGRVGVAIGWGPISDVGYLAHDNDKALLVKRMSGNVEFTSVQATRALEQVLARGAAAEPVVHISTMSWNVASATLKTLAAPTFQLFKLLGKRSEVETGDQDLRTMLLGMPANRAEEKLTSYLVEKIAHILQVAEKAVSVIKPITELGVELADGGRAWADASG